MHDNPDLVFGISIRYRLGQGVGECSDGLDQVLDPLDGRHEDWDVGDKKTRN